MYDLMVRVPARQWFEDSGSEPERMLVNTLQDSPRIVRLGHTQKLTRGWSPEIEPSEDR